MEFKSINPNTKQSEKVKELSISTSTLKRYRKEVNMQSPYRILQTSNTKSRKQKTSNYTDHDLKMTSNDPKITSNDIKMTSNEPVKIK